MTNIFLENNLYVSTIFVPELEKDFFLKKCFFDKLKYLQEKRPLVLPQITKHKEKIYIPSIGNFIFVRNKGKAFLYFNTEDSALVEAHEIFFQIKELYDEANAFY